MQQTSNNTELSFQVFLPFFSLHNFLPLTGRKNCLPLTILPRQQQELYHPPGKQQAFGENRFLLGDVPIVLGSRA